ncbi:MAG TPA: Ulp1 family isopeptidase [Waddliaceae bacterium]
MSAIAPLEPLSRSAHTPANDNRQTCQRTLLFVVAIISALGSLVASGLLFPHIGYSSLAIAGVGLAIALGCVLYLSCRSTTPTQERDLRGSEQQSTLGQDLTKITPQKIEKRRDTDKEYFNKWGISDGRVITNFIIDEYFLELAERHHEFIIPQWGTRAQINSETDNVVDSMQTLLDKPETQNASYLAMHLHLSGKGWKHYTLIFIDNVTRCVEFYDSVVQSANHRQVEVRLKEIATLLSAKYPGPRPYEMSCKITKPLQWEGPDCGVWVMYFAAEKLNDPTVNFNHINGKKRAESIVRDYRKTVSEILIAREKKIDQELLEERLQKEKRLQALAKEQ